VQVTRYCTLAYGEAPAVYRQSLMLLLSLVAYAPEPFELVVATDHPGAYVWFGTRVDVEYLDPAQLDLWRGARPFSMRQKIELARLAAGCSPEPAATVLLDADVLAVKPLDAFVARLHAGELFMHKQEFVLSQSRRPGNRRLRASLQRLPPDPVEGPVRDDDAMWNSGVLGVPSADRALLDRALGFYDRIAAAGVRHFATEQLVEGIVLGRTGRLRPAAEWFAHYWGNKAGYDAEIARRLSDVFIEGLTVTEAAARYREHPIVLPAEVRPTRRQKVAAWLRNRRV
jgi:hypothetical protein